MKAFVPDVGPVQSKFAACRRELSEALIERDSAIDLVFTAVIAREHVLAVGPRVCSWNT